jgi:hypothetical protein
VRRADATKAALEAERGPHETAKFVQFGSLVTSTSSGESSAQPDAPAALRRQRNVDNYAALAELLPQAFGRPYRPLKCGALHNIVAPPVKELRPCRVHATDH